MSNPIKISFKTEWFSLSLLILSFLAAFYLYQVFPAQVATHWGLNGEVNGYSSPFAAAFLIPFLLLGMYILFYFLPYFDPKKDQYASFSSVYHKLRDLLITFLFAIFLLTSLSSLGNKIDIGFYIALMLGALFIFLGLLLRKVKMNWFLGIRTPWTLSSEAVWNKTHKLGGFIMPLAGLLIAATVLVTEKFKIILFVIAIALIALVLSFYSYYLFMEEKKKKK